MKLNKAALLLAVLYILSLLSACISARVESGSAPTEESAEVTPAQESAAGEESGSEATSAVAAEIQSSGEKPGEEEIPVDLSELSGSYRITEAGTYRLTGGLFSGQIVIEAPEDAKVKLILDGVGIRMDKHAAIYAISADKLVLSSSEGSSNMLSSDGDFVQMDENKVDAAVFAKCDLTINGSGTIAVTCETGHGVVTKDDLKIKSGTLSVEAAEQGLNGKDSITVDGGAISIRCGGDGVHTEGDAEFSGGTLVIESGDDGVHADGALTISGGALTVSRCLEGLEAHQITISSGEIRVTAADDGLNAAGGDSSGRDPFKTDSDAFITISGGTLIVNANGDGIDTNGILSVSGGEVFVSGPTNGGNGSLDYGISGSISGGTVIAAGSAGMAVNFGAESTQGSILLNVGEQAAGTTITVIDESGTVLASFTPDKRYESVVVSAPGMVLDGSYTVTAGSFTQTVTLESIVYGGASGFGGPGGPGGPGGGPGGPGGGPGGRGGR